MNFQHPNLTIMNRFLIDNVCMFIDCTDNFSYGGPNSITSKIDKKIVYLSSKGLNISNHIDNLRTKFLKQSLGITIVSKG